MFVRELNIIEKIVTKKTYVKIRNSEHMHLKEKRACTKKESKI